MIQGVRNFNACKKHLSSICVQVNIHDSFCNLQQLEMGYFFIFILISCFMPPNVLAMGQSERTIYPIEYHENSYYLVPNKRPSPRISIFGNFCPKYCYSLMQKVSQSALQLFFIIQIFFQYYFARQTLILASRLLDTEE